jgi:hypothetical protein
MAIPDRFEALLKHPAPGLHFPPPRYAEVGEYILPVAHRPGSPAAPAGMKTLREFAGRSDAVLAQLAEFYRRYNGVDLCCLPDVLNGGEEAGLAILPIEQWELETDDLTGPDAEEMFEGLEDMYKPGNFVVIGTNNSEGTRLVLFTAGEDGGQPLAGKLTCVALDPVLGFDEIVAPTFYDLLETFAADPAAFLKRIGYCHAVRSKAGRLYGAVADQYLPDIRGLPHVV